MYNADGKVGQFDTWICFSDSRGAPFGDLAEEDVGNDIRRETELRTTGEGCR